MRTPIHWYGGKGHMTAKIVPLLPPHRIYVEPFGGGASILLAKPPSPVEVYNDIDSGLVNFFRVLRDPEKFARFYRLASLTPVSREEYKFCCATWRDCEDEVERAYRWFVVARQSISGKHGAGWGFTVTASSRGMAGSTSRWLSCLENLPQVAERLLRVQIEHDDFRAVLERYDSPETLFYCDPPYVLSARRGSVYQHEMSDEDHRDLVQRLLSLQGQVVLSGYEHPLYQPLTEAGWEVHRFPTSCHAAARIRTSPLRGKGAATAHAPRTEVVWVKRNSGQAGLPLTTDG